MNVPANPFLLTIPALFSTGVAIAVYSAFRGQLGRTLKRHAIARDEIAKESRLLTQEIAFYEDKKTSLDRRAAQRRVLSEAARGLGSLMDPAAIEQKLLEISTLLFPSQPIRISHGQETDGIDSYVAQRRQPLLIPSEAMKGSPMMAAPISAQQSVVGVLRVGGISSVTKPYTRDDLRLLEILANLASLAMDNCILLHNVEQTALRDNLTGLLTHRAFQDELEQAILEASRFNQPLTLILVDVDHFKSVNDTHGHQAGDQVLQGLAHVMDQNVRPVDVIARYGGEEFAILLLQTPHADGIRIAEQIRRELGEQVFDVGAKRISITGSFGVATFPEDATSGQQLFRQADQRLYKAKASGRNQVQSRGR